MNGLLKNALQGGRSYLPAGNPGTCYFGGAFAGAFFGAAFFVCAAAALTEHVLNNGSSFERSSVTSIAGWQLPLPTTKMWAYYPILFPRSRSAMTLALSCPSGSKTKGRGLVLIGEFVDVLAQVALVICVWFLKI